MCVLVAQSCPTFWDPVDCSPPGSSVHGLLQARILEWVAIPFSRRSPLWQALVSTEMGSPCWGTDYPDTQFSSVAQSRLTLCDPVDCSTPGFPVHHQLPELAQTHVHQVGDAIQPSHPLSYLLLLPSIFPSIRVFSNESALCISWPKNWSFSFSISPSNEYSGLIFLRIDWFDLLVVQGTLKSVLQHSVQKHQFFSAQLSL